MSAPLPELCPRVRANQPMADGSACCRVPAIIPPDKDRHQCRLHGTAPHVTHVCWCGQDWTGR
jgi:hypothetical protein